ncbi:CGP-CTERM sorting domain-containing protein [Thermococcus sp. GR7]|uniref:glutaredoxin domain-containing protein n=1 Tax=unclassified Thermococcus TaxID=2627626 RepID=UPI0014308F78|nr:MULTISPECIES: glutaredoxin domain-containing protein [unclassified Thermococcus]NJE46452.1 CGP-CTERM sorting domain-containing protein [Thermococcus sp. GR7]NJE77629.1 CGP-CTERM sorting domain-containing protein [Thermococcus sp. GR4]NJF23922.1 CGP-CTERM sorting domain-containing protein [Thermococcus sp. GR5]
MRRTALLLLFLLTVSLLSYAVAETQIDSNKVHFYMYGMSTCPHCQNMKKLIPEIYGLESLTYYELVNNEENQKLFGEQYKYTGIMGVPAVAITYNGTLYAIIEGEFNVSATPEIIEAAMENNGLILFVAGQAYIIKNETIIQKLQTIYVEHRLPEADTTETSEITTSTPSEDETTSTSENNDKVCGPGIMAVLVIVPIVLLRRRR